MQGIYHGVNYVAPLALVQNGKAITFSPASNGTFSIVDGTGAELWRSTKLPICKYLSSFRYSTFYMESYAPFVGLYNEAGQLLWKFGKITDCSLTQQF